MVPQKRIGRIERGIQEMLSEILLHEVTDPRLQGVFVTGVSVDRELTLASVHVSAIEGVERSREVLEAFEHASGFLRSAMAQRSNLRVFPRLRFVWDKTAEQADRIENLLSSIRKDSEEKSL